METNLSFKRIGLLLRKDWIEYKKKMAFMALTIAGALIIVMIFSFWGNKMMHPFPFYVIASIGILIGYCRYIGMVVHQPKGINLTLPASSAEKYIVLLLEGVLAFVVFQLIFWIGTGLWSFFFPMKIIHIKDILLDGASLAFVSFVSSLLFLSFMTFKKYAFGIAIGGFASVLASLVGIIYLSKDFLFPVEGCLYYDAATPFFTTLTWLAKGFTPVFLIATLVVLYLAYLKLKEKELR